MGEVRLRKAVLQDMELLYEWANEEMVRRNSITTHKIELEEHKNWFQNKLNCDVCDMFIYLLDEKPIGQVRLDYKEQCGWISFSIDHNYRGQGHGGNILCLAEEEVRKSRPMVSSLAGVVKNDNIASQKKFVELKYNIDDQYEDKNLILYRKKIR